MENEVLNNEQVIREKLALIIKEVVNIEIVSDTDSLFNFQHNLSAESLVYVLLRASEELGFEINDSFVNTLEDYSFQNIIKSAMDYRAIIDL